MGYFRAKALGKAKMGAKKLRRQNMRYTQMLPDYLGRGASEIRIRRAEDLRGRHIAKLKRLPFFKELLSKQEKVEFEHDGKKESFTLLRNAIGSRGSGEEAIVIIDARGKASILMRYKTEGKIQWMPSLVGFLGEKGDRQWVSKQQLISGKWGDYYSAVSEEVRKREGKIRFNEKWGFRKMEQVKRYL